MKKTTFYIPIRISGLSDGKHQFPFSVLPGELELPEEFHDAVAVTVDVEKSHAHLFLHITVSATADFPCDRCLASVRVPIDASFDLLFAKDMTSARTLNEDEVRIIDPGDSAIELAPDVRDFILLNVPMRRVCGEDENGNFLCAPEFQQHLVPDTSAGTDPRWDRLKSLK